MRGHRRKTDSTVIDSDGKLSWLQNHLPDGPGTATAESERDPMVEADELALSKYVRGGDDQRRGRGATHPNGHDEVARTPLRELQANVARTRQDDL
jgi:hypothetical protein